jgi:hypothetical protein
VSDEVSAGRPKLSLAPRSAAGAASATAAASTKVRVVRTRQTDTTAPVFCAVRAGADAACRPALCVRSPTRSARRARARPSSLSARA